MLTHVTSRNLTSVELNKIITNFWIPDFNFVFSTNKSYNK